MSNRSRLCDVFIANSPSDAPMAARIADAFRASGLQALTSEELPPVPDVADALWEALAESRALIVVLPASGPTDAMWFEIGAVRAWSKPVFAVPADQSIHRNPALSEVRFYSLSRLDELIYAVRALDPGLSTEDASKLVEVYEEIAEPVDRLMIDPALRGRLIRRFADRAGRTVPEERLLSELLRLRKQGKLRRSGTRSRAKPPIGSA